jgi:hypothetical protein
MIKRIFIALKYKLADHGSRQSLGPNMDGRNGCVVGRRSQLYANLGVGPGIEKWMARQGIDEVRRKAHHQSRQ